MRINENTDIDKGMFPAVLLKTCVTSWGFYSSVSWEQDAHKTKLATTRNSLPSRLLTRLCESWLLKEHLAEVCMSRMVISWELDWPRYRMAEAARGEWVTIPPTIVVIRKFQEKLPGQRGEGKGLVSTDSPSHHLFCLQGYRKLVLYVQQPRKQQSVGWSSCYGTFKS